MKELICIICPRGCHLSVDEETLAVSGNTCPRGAEYGRSEVSNPVRTVTGSVKACGGLHPMLPVRTDKPVSKAKMFEIMETLHSFTANCPVHRGDVLIADVCGTGANIISCKGM